MNSHKSLPFPLSVFSTICCGEYNSHAEVFASFQCEKTYCDISSLVPEPMFFGVVGAGKKEEAGNTTNPPVRFFKAWRTLKIAYSPARRLAWACLGASHSDFHWFPELLGRTELERPAMQIRGIGVLSIIFSVCHFMHKGNSPSP